MRALHFFTLLLASMGLLAAATDEQYLDSKDVQILLKTTHFGFGSVGMGPNVPEGEAALRRIMQKDDAMQFLLPVFEHGTAEGKCYALVGFRLLSPKHFEASCQRLARWNNITINTVSGCIVDKTKLAEVVQTIQAGTYDSEALGRR